MKELKKKNLETLAKIMPVISEVEQSIYIGGDLYQVNLFGSVRLVERNSDNFDTLTSQYENAGSIQVSKDILSGMVGNGATCIVPSSSTCKTLFEYCANNTGVEWGYRIDKMGNHVIWTDNQMMSLSVDDYITGMCTNIVHSHVSSSGGPSDEDIEYAKKFPGVTFQIYCNGKYVKYDGNGIIE